MRHGTCEAWPCSHMQMDAHSERVPVLYNEDVYLELATDTPPAHSPAHHQQAPSSLAAGRTCTGPVCTGAGVESRCRSRLVYVPVPKGAPGRCLIAHAHAYNVPKTHPYYSSCSRVGVVTPRRIARQVCQVSRPPTCEKLAAGDTAEICPWRRRLLRIPSAPAACARAHHVLLFSSAQRAGTQKLPADGLALQASGGRSTRWWRCRRRPRGRRPADPQGHPQGAGWRRVLGETATELYRCCLSSRSSSRSGRSRSSSARTWPAMDAAPAESRPAAAARPPKARGRRRARRRCSQPSTRPPRRGGAAPRRGRAEQRREQRGETRGQSPLPIDQQYPPPLPSTTTVSVRSGGEAAPAHVCWPDCGKSACAEEAGWR